jgi:hypothetical protein
MNLKRFLNQNIFSGYMVGPPPLPGLKSTSHYALTFKYTFSGVHHYGGPPGLKSPLAQFLQMKKNLSIR